MNTRWRSSSCCRSRRTSSSSTRMGWHPAEVDAANPNSEWQWTQKRAAFSFRNPKKDASFYLEYDARTDLFTPPQQVTIRIGDAVLTTFAADSRERKLLIIPDHGRPARHRRHGRDGHRARQDLQARRRRSARAGIPRLPHVHRAEVANHRPPSWAFGPRPEASTVAFLDSPRADGKLSVSHEADLQGLLWPWRRLPSCLPARLPPRLRSLAPARPCRSRAIASSTATASSCSCGAAVR